MKHIKEFADHLNEMDMNDPILVLSRAAKDKAARSKEDYKQRLAKRIYGKKREVLERELEDIGDEIKDLFSAKTEAYKNQDAEAGQKGEDWSDDDANEYGEILNDIDKKLEALLKKRKELETKLAY